MTENHLEQLPKDIYNELCDFAQPKLNVSFGFCTSPILMYDVQTKYFGVDGSVEFIYKDDFFWYKQCFHRVCIDVNEMITIRQEKKRSLYNFHIPTISYKEELIKAIKKINETETFTDCEYDDIYIDEKGFLKGRKIGRVREVWQISKKTYLEYPTSYVMEDDDWEDIEQEACENLTNGKLFPYVHHIVLKGVFFTVVMSSSTVQNSHTGEIFRIRRLSRRN
jgi:hypothetical protein